MGEMTSFTPRDPIEIDVTGRCLVVGHEPAVEPWQGPLRVKLSEPLLWEDAHREAAKASRERPELRPIWVLRIVLVLPTVPLEQNSGK